MSGSTGKASTFRVGLVQMRAGRAPAGNLDAAAKLIGEAKRGGADYVQTPEMTNIMELGREKVLAAIVAEEQDASLATFRELARSLGIYLHIGSLAVKVSPDKAANRAFLIDPQGEVVARYDQDPYVRRRSRQWRELPRVAELPGGRVGCRARPAVGPARADHLLRPALPRALPRAGGGGRFVPRDPVGLPAADRRGALERAQPRARHRERLLCVLRGARRQARERPRDLWPFDGGRPLGPHRRRGRHRARRGVADVDPAEVAAARGRVPSLQHGRRFEMVEPLAEPAHLRAVRSPA